MKQTFFEGMHEIRRELQRILRNPIPVPNSNSQNLKTQYPIPNSNSENSKTQYPIPNSNSKNPIAIAIAIVKKPNSIAIAIGYWVLVLHVYFQIMAR